jgi:hypothetical protein
VAILSSIYANCAVAMTWLLSFCYFLLLVPLYEIVEVYSGWPQATPRTKVTIGSFYATLGGSWFI